MLGLAQVLLDRGSGGHGPLALQPNDRRLILRVDEVRFDQAAGQQRSADQDHEDDEVLPEQPAPTCRQNAVCLRDRPLRDMG